jgi:tricorn protease
LTGPLVFAQETRLLRSPSINHDKISFVYAGDIWVAGKDGSNVQRITAFDGVNPIRISLKWTINCFYRRV